MTVTCGATRGRRRVTATAGSHRASLRRPWGGGELRLLKLRNAHSALCDQLFGAGATKANTLETLVSSCWVRGLSGRDIEAMLGEVFGDECQGAQGHRQPHMPAPAGRDRRVEEEGPVPDEGRLPLPWLEHFKMHPKAKAEPWLAVWGIDTDGRAVFLGLAPGATESAGAWGSSLENLKDRGLRSPVLVIDDGGKGLCAAIGTYFAHSLQQPCIVHTRRNLVGKVPLHAQGEVKAD